MIPFGKAARVGNYKVWRGRYTVGSGKDKLDMECIHVSSLDGSWMVRIPSSTTMFTLICNGWATIDEKMRDEFLGMVFANIFNTSTSGSEAFHDLVFFMTEVISFPYLLLSEKDMKERMDKSMKELGFDKSKRKEHIGKLCEYRKQLYELMERKRDRLIGDYERQQAEQREYSKTHEDEDMKHDELAEQAMDVLNGEVKDEGTDSEKES